MTTIHDCPNAVSEEVSTLENTQVVEINIHELLEDHAKFNQHDTILSPIDKFDNEVHVESTNDSISTAADKSTGSHTPQKPKRKVFDFDVKKVFSFTQAKEKKTPIKEEKPQDSVVNQSDEKKLKSDEKKTKSEEKKPKVEPIKSQFVLFGQVINHNFLNQNDLPDLMTQVIVQEPIKIEADPSLFSIDDESPAKQDIRPKVENKDNKENKPQAPKAIKTYEIVSFKPTQFYKAEKDNKKTGFANFFKSKLQRYIGFQDKHIIIGEKMKDELKIKSKTPINKLFQISIEVLI